MGEKKGMSFTPRSGDTHVIGDDGEAVNVDAQARGAALATVVDREVVPLAPTSGDLSDPPAPIAPDVDAGGLGHASAQPSTPLAPPPRPSHAWPPTRPTR
ncbi:hypothetical protein MRBLMC3_002917 [Sphingobium sp. LMC3-1-1.1]|uniref:hypothetical protein n=1 Tax=Sphingobium sp. LMC3-1-1.1 TaxID=3135241 RepID=UPI0034142620